MAEFDEFEDTKPVVVSVNPAGKPSAGKSGSGNFNGQQQDAQPIGRVKLPRGREVIGVIEQRVGGARMIIKCLDGKSRNCRVPGRLKKHLWLRERDVVLIEPWECDNTRGDVVFKYKPAEIQWLRTRGYMKEVDEF